MLMLASMPSGVQLQTQVALLVVMKRFVGFVSAMSVSQGSAFAACVAACDVLFQCGAFGPSNQI